MILECPRMLISVTRATGPYYYFPHQSEQCLTITFAQAQASRPGPNLTLASTWISLGHSAAPPVKDEIPDGPPRLCWGEGCVHNLHGLIDVTYDQVYVDSRTESRRRSNAGEITRICQIRSHKVPPSHRCPHHHSRV
ncbi:hypothetical protein CERSUDRAFT_117173 [Gelatoporia subvermispora B]|uniref:Uncharacterized protein n=1 Tax=Ceriporiopsis subvermispora (strain B) TaxID=914234 RepID=M2QQ32_CERS8|nr:hypothetical protein CERSUDRAFT_117173 [Gelatoporia subvermispora B]